MWAKTEGLKLRLKVKSENSGVTGYSENGRKQAKTTENQRKRPNITTFPTILQHMLM